MRRTALKPVIFDTYRYRNPRDLASALTDYLVKFYKTGEKVWVKDEGNLLRSERADLLEMIKRDTKRKLRDFDRLEDAIGWAIENAETEEDYILALEDMSDHKAERARYVSILKGLTVIYRVSKMTGIPGYEVRLY